MRQLLDVRLGDRAFQTFLFLAAGRRAAIHRDLSRLDWCLEEMELSGPGEEESSTPSLVSHKLGLPVTKHKLTREIQMEV